MEGAPRPEGRPGFDVGLLAIPVVFALAAVAAYLLFAAAALSVSTLNYDLSVQPGLTLAGYTVFFSGRGPSFIVASLALALRVSLYAAGPALVLGYFLALKARRWVRQLGVFLLVLAWILSYVRAAAFINFFGFTGGPVSLGAAWFPWLAVTPGGDPALPLMWIVLPSMALPVYASLRGFFLGLRWRSYAVPRTTRFVREAVPRGAAGLALGTVLAGGTVFADTVVARLYGGTATTGIGTYLAMALAQFGYVTVAAVIAVLMLLLVAAAYIGFVAVVFVVRWLTPRYFMVKPTPLDLGQDRALSEASLIMTGLVSVFLLASLFIPLVIAAVFSFNHDNNVAVFGQFSTRWWVTEPGLAEVRALFADPDFSVALWGSGYLALLVAGAGTPLGFLAAYAVPYLGDRSRLGLRLVMYAALVVPLALMASLGVLRAAWDALGIASANLDPYIIVALVPVGAAVVFIFTRTALAFSRPRTRQFGFVWLRAAIAGALASFSFFLGAYIGYTGTTVTGFVYGTLLRRIPTPEVDAAIALVSVLATVPLAAAFLVIHDREAFRL